jgi:hypothetical protein
MTLRFDKKGRPYLACQICQTKVFSHGGLPAIAGYSMVAEMTRDYISKHGKPDFMETVYERADAIGRELETETRTPAAPTGVKQDVR